MRAYFSHLWRGSSVVIVNKWNQWLLKINDSLDLCIPWLILSGMSTLSPLFFLKKRCSHVLATHSHSPMCILCDTYTLARTQEGGCPSDTLGQSWEWITWNQCANERNYKPDDSLSSWGKINCVKSPCSMVGSIVCTSQFNINIVLCIWHCLTLNEIWLSCLIQQAWWAALLSFYYYPLLFLCLPPPPLPS